MTTYGKDTKHKNKRTRKSARTVGYTLKVTDVGETYRAADIIKRMEEIPTPDTRLGKVPAHWIPANSCSLAHKLRQFPQHWKMVPISPENKSVNLWERIA